MDCLGRKVERWMKSIGTFSSCEGTFLSSDGKGTRITGLISPVGKEVLGRVEGIADETKMYSASALLSLPRGF